MTYLQHPLWPPVSPWEPTPVGRLPRWVDARRVAVDCETFDPDLTTMGPGVRRGGRVVGVSFALEDGPAHYLPVGHLGGDNLPADHVWAYLKDQAAAFRGVLVGANLQYDLDYLQEAGVGFAPSWFRDVQVAEPLLDELQWTYGLEAIAGRYGRPGKDDALLREAARAYGLHPKKDLWRLPARYVGPYAERDVRLPLDLLRLQERRIEDQDLGRVWDLESRVLPVLVKMRRRGVRIDLAALDRIERWTEGEESAALGRVRELTGVGIEVCPPGRPSGEVWLPDLVERALRAAGACLTKRTPSGKKFSVDASVLDSLAVAGCEVAALIKRARKVNKVRTTFAASVRRFAVAGRVHPTFNQLRVSSDSAGDDEGGAAFGRLSCVDPNLQQQVGRDEELAPMWRAVYLPDEGKLWAANDYSSQEPRWAVHFGVRIAAPGAAEIARRFRDDPDLDLHQMTADMAGIKRKDAKTIFLGLMYGMGGAKLCRSLGLPTKWVPARGDRFHRVNPETGTKEVEVAGDAGQEFIDGYHAMVPFVRALTETASRKAATAGYVRTWSGRRCRFEKGPRGYEYTHKAANRVVQGSSADQTKTALVELDAAGYGVQLQVHDEIDASVTDAAEARAMARIMEDCVPMEVPSRVDVEIGESWGAAR